MRQLTRGEANIFMFSNEWYDEPGVKFVELEASELSNFETGCGTQGDKMINSKIEHLLENAQFSEILVCMSKGADHETDWVIDEMYITDFADHKNINKHQFRYFLEEYTGMRVEMNPDIYLESE